ASEHLYVDSSVGASNVIPTVAPAAALTFSPTDAPTGLTDDPADPLTNLSSEDEYIEGLLVASAEANIPSREIRALTFSTEHSILPPASQSTVKATSKTALPFKQVMQLASKSAKESDSEVRMQELSTNMSRMIKLQEAFDIKQEKMNQLQNQVLEQQEEMKRLQKQALEEQEKMGQLQNEMKQLQIKNHDEAMGQLAALQSRIQAVLTQTFELHEYPIPRLFIVLSQDPAGWDAVDPFTNKFRLYFLCECGEHTKLANGKTKIPHHIHLAKHEGYEITRPTEFFRQYGPYILTILKMLKLGITVAGVAMPALSQLISPDIIGQSIDSLKQLQDNIMPSVDQVIDCMDSVAEDEGKAVEDISMSKGRTVEEAAEHMDTMEALEGADQRKLSSFLQDKDDNKVLGNLYRTVTVEGHVKWVCIDHYRENYQETQAEAFQQALGSVGGSFDENTGSVTVKLRSRLLAEQFYAGLGKARSVLELDVDLDFECTMSDLEGLEIALRTSSISILRLDHRRFRTTVSSKLLSWSTQQDVLFRIMKLPNMKVIRIILSKEFGKPSSFLPKTLFHLQKLSLEMVVGSKENNEVRILAEMLKVSSTPITWYIYYISIGDNGAQALPEALKTRLALTSLNLEWSPFGHNGAQALSEAQEINPTLTTLKLYSNWIGHNGVQALSEALKFNLTLTTLNLGGNSIGDNGAQELSEALKTNSTLTSLNLGGSRIGHNGVQALSEALKINSTLTTLNLRGNSIRNDGAQVLSEALKTNSTLTTFDSGFNMIGDDGAQALSEVLKINSTLITLNLEFNGIRHSGAQALSEALKINSTLTTLSLRSNSIGDNGAQALSEALKTNLTLTTLNLEANPIGDNGAQALSEALKINSTLTTLDLGYNKIGDNGAQALSEALKTNSTLTTLSLRSNSIEDNGAQALSEALKINSTLTTLNLEFNSIGDNGAQALSEVLKTNSTMRTLRYRLNLT
ncbi:hypothetical protein BGZ99_001294, partial [Dissophora globulifera]